MDIPLVGFIELLLALVFVVGWGLIEWTLNRRDRRRAAEQAAAREGDGGKS